jgi:NADP-dependent 3-hydroxy acid dehydrogenase YdfG
MGVLTGRTVLVTGATGALGPAAVAAAAGAGARLVLVGRDRDRLAAVGDPHADAVAAVHVADLLDADAVGRLATEAGPSVDAVWHLVGGWRGGSPMPEQPLEDWDWLHDQLVRTTVHVARAFAGALAARPAGRLVVVSSPMALAPTSRNAAYAAAKAAAEATVLALADQLTGTPATANVVVVPAIGDRGVPADEVAATLVYVTSDAAARMNGQRIRLYAGGPS